MHLEMRFFFRAKKVQFEKAGAHPNVRFAISQKPFLEASYKVAYRTVKRKKPHTVRETLVKPCALHMVELVYGLEQGKKLEGVPLSNYVIRSRRANGFVCLFVCFFFRIQ
jgi:hypothetical protein